ncbi:MAG: ceramidase domain-containing protein [Archangium sp.]|nr:ceramidase domain-containing protein [Archangium sp.]
MWEGWELATCMPNDCFCEAVRDGAIRQPSNTWSSLTFCVATFVMMPALLRGEVGRLTKLEAWLFAIAVFLVGVTSAFYHASLSFFGQYLDVQSMYLLVVLAFSVNLDALRPGKPKQFLLTYVSINVIFGVLLVFVPAFRRFAFAGVILSVIATEVILRQRKLRDWNAKPLIAAAVLQGIAFVIWNLDRAHIVCDPTFPIQGHAVWHTLGACASFALWRYFTSASASVTSRPPATS